MAEALADIRGTGVTSEALALIELASIARGSPGGRRHAQARAGEPAARRLGQPRQVPGSGRRRRGGRRRGVSRRPRGRRRQAWSTGCSSRRRTLRCGRRWRARHDPAIVDSLGIVETTTVAATLLAADAAAKAAAVRLIELQLGPRHRRQGVLHRHRPPGRGRGGRRGGGRDPGGASAVRDRDHRRPARRSHAKNAGKRAPSS